MQVTDTGLTAAVFYVMNSGMLMGTLSSTQPGDLFVSYRSSNTNDLIKKPVTSVDFSHMLVPAYRYLSTKNSDWLNRFIDHALVLKLGLPRY